MQKTFGTPYYIAPEMLGKDGYSEKCDLWSIGVILYIIMSGVPPFIGNSQEEILDNVQRGEWCFPESQAWLNASEEVKDLITKLMTKDPEQRISALDALTHPWITK